MLLPEETTTQAHESAAGAAQASPRDIDLLRQAVAAHRSGNKPQARELLIEASEINPNNELVWLWRSSVAAGYREAMSSLDRVLDLNPTNLKAQQWKEKLKAARREALRRAGLPPDEEDRRPAPEQPEREHAGLNGHAVNGSGAAAAPAQEQPVATPASDQEDDDPLRKLLGQDHEASESGSPFEENRRDPFAEEEQESAGRFDSEREEAREASLEALLGQSATSAAAPVEESRAEVRPWGDPVEQKEVEQKEVEQEETERGEEVEPQGAVDEQDAASVFEESTEEATAEEENSEQQAAAACPVCEVQWEEPQRICPNCRSISDPVLVEDAPQHEGADRSSLREAESRLTELIETAPSFEAFRALGLVYLNLRQSNDALLQFREAHRIDPSDQGVRQAVIALERRKLILAVDDSKTVQRMISSVLEKERYRVAIAADGLQALARLDEEMPALVLLDITMPRMDGYQTCKVISGNEATKHIPVIMLSGKDGFFDKVRGRMVGASNYITKPFEPAALLKAIRKQTADD